MLQRLVGSANETKVEINGVKCSALIDSSSMVSTISEEFLQRNLLYLPVNTLEDMLLKD